jgi:small subunit ribosomal protein S16
MSVVIRLMRAGAKKRPFFRMVAADSRRQRDGRFLEILGHYNPLTQPFELMVHKDRIETWISKGAQPSEQVASLLRSLGIPTQAPATRVASPAAGDKPARGASKRERKRTLSPRKVRARAARKAGKKKAVKAV